MSINGDCIYCAGHSTDEEWDRWNGECQWCGEFDVEWEPHDHGESESSDNEFDDIDRDDYGDDWD